MTEEIKKKRKAIEKIRRLERQLDVAISDKRIERITREITRLQLRYNIATEEWRRR